MIYRRDRYLRGGDHSAFNSQGFAAVRFTEYREDFHHQHENPRTEKGIEYGDLPKFVDFAYVANVARLNAATLAALALSPAAPVKPRLLTKGLENDSKLEWDAVLRELRVMKWYGGRQPIRIFQPRIRRTSPLPMLTWRNPRTT